MADSISKTRGQVSELTHLVPIRRGLVPPAESAAAGSASESFADRLQTILRAFDDREGKGLPSVIRLFRQIHSAKWAILDGGTRLLLSVLFDGDWNDYMRALARDVPGLLHLIFANTVGWDRDFAEPTRSAEKRAAALMQFIRDHQVEVTFLYVHRTDLTVRDVDKLLPEPRPLAAEDSLARELGSLAERRKILLEEYAAQHSPAALEQAKQRFRAVLAPRYPEAAFALAYQEAFGQDVPMQGGSR